MQDRRPPLGVFVGRAAELARVAEVIAMVEAGQPWLVAIEGDPGVGKTTLARRCLAEAEGTGLRVLPARGDQAEADLDFGLVDQMLRASGKIFRLVGSADGIGSAISSFAVGARLLEVVGEQPAGRSVAIFIDGLQWADRQSVEALTFMLRRVSVDPVITVVTYRGPGDRLDEAAQRMLSSVENRLHIPLEGLGLDEVASLAAALGTGSLDDEVVRRLYQDTGGHPLYLRTLLSEGSGFDLRAPGRAALPRSLAGAIGDHLRGLPSATVAVLEMLAVLSLRIPLTQLGQAAQARPARPAPRSSRRWPPAWWSGGPKNLPARWRSATRWSGTRPTRASRPPGAACCTPAPPRWSARQRRGSTGWPPWTGRMRTWPPSWNSWPPERRRLGIRRWPPPTCSGPRTSPRPGPAGNGGC